MFGEFTNNNDDGKKTSACTGTYNYLLGCMVQSNWHDYDGSYPTTVKPHDRSSLVNYAYSASGATCTAVHGANNDRSIGNKQCCKSPTYAFTCVLRYSEPSTPATSSYEGVECTTGYTMVGCSVYGYYNNDGSQQSAWITSWNECGVRSSNAAYAIAICCKLETPEPTDDPTIDPTESPTSDPTIDPTIDPTGDPTADPTAYPTFEPTVDPTMEPTTQPSNFPTKRPSQGERIIIDNKVTSAPSISPTVVTNSPTRSPLPPGSLPTLFILALNPDSEKQNMFILTSFNRFRWKFWCC